MEKEVTVKKFNYGGTAALWYMENLCVTLCALCLCSFKRKDIPDSL